VRAPVLLRAAVREAVNVSGGDGEEEAVTDTEGDSLGVAVAEADVLGDHPSDGDALGDAEGVPQGDGVPEVFDEAEDEAVAGMLREAEGLPEIVDENVLRALAVDVAHAECVKVATAVELLVAAAEPLRVTEGDAEADAAPLRVAMEPVGVLVTDPLPVAEPLLQGVAEALAHEVREGVAVAEAVFTEAVAEAEKDAEIVAVEEEEGIAERDSEGEATAVGDPVEVGQGVALCEGVKVVEKLLAAEGLAASEALPLVVDECEGLPPLEAEADTEGVELPLAREDAERETLLDSHALREREARAVADEVILTVDVGEYEMMGVVLAQKEVVTVAVGLRLNVLHGEGLPDCEGEPEKEGVRVAVGEGEMEAVIEPVAPCDAEFVELPENLGLPEVHADKVLLPESAIDTVGETVLVGEVEAPTDALLVTQLEKLCVEQRDNNTVAEIEPPEEPDRDAD
jgi:hypothetical protein